MPSCHRFLNLLLALAIPGSGPLRAERLTFLSAPLTLRGEAPGVLHLVGEGFGGAGAPVRVQVDDRVVPARVINAFHIICLGPADLTWAGRITVAVRGGACAYALARPPLQGELDPSGLRLYEDQHPLDARFEDLAGLAFAPAPGEATPPGNPGASPAGLDDAPAKRGRQRFANDHTTVGRFGRPVHFWTREARLIQLLRAKAGQTATWRELAEAGWGAQSSPTRVSEEALSSAMAGLARKLHGPGETDCLHEVPGLGYRLDLPKPTSRGPVWTGRHITSYGRTVKLSRTGARLFQALAATPGQAVALADLARAGWLPQAEAAGNRARTLAELSRLRLALRAPQGVDPLPHDALTDTIRLDPACLEAAPAAPLTAAGPDVVHPVTGKAVPGERRILGERVVTDAGPASSSLRVSSGSPALKAGALLQRKPR